MAVRPKPTASRRSGIPARPPLTSIPREQATRPRFFLHQHPEGVPARRLNFPFPLLSSVALAKADSRYSDFRFPFRPRYSVTGNSKKGVGFPPFPRLVNPGQPLVNKAFSAQTTVAKPSSKNFFTPNTIFRYSVTGAFPETVVRWWRFGAKGPRTAAGSATVPQVSQPAVSPISQSAGRSPVFDWRIVSGLPPQSGAPPGRRMA